MKSILCILLLVGATAVTLTACHSVDLQNGEIPQAYLPQALVLVGTYRGTLQGSAAELSLRLNGSQVDVDFNGSTDFISLCKAHIEGVKTIHLKGPRGHKQLAYVTFGFDRGKCPELLSSTIEMSFEQTDQGMVASLDYLAAQTIDGICHWEPRGVALSPIEICEFRQTPVFESGHFTKN